MSGDIVERLRNAAVGMPQDDMNQAAADTIEARDAEITRLRAECDDLRYELSLVAHERALSEMREARRD